MVDTQQVQPVAYRLLAGDELGVLRGVHPVSTTPLVAAWHQIAVLMASLD